MAAQPTAEEMARRAREYRERALEAFSFELLETAGNRALSTREQLKGAGRGLPVVIGDEEFVEPPIGPLQPGLAQSKVGCGDPGGRGRHSDPDDLAAHKAQEEKEAHEYLRQLYESKPDAPMPRMIVTDSNGTRELTREETRAAMLIPTDDWTTVPAHLRYGGWNACPKSEYHVAALRSWRDRYGAELIGLSFDRMDLRVATRPQTRSQALELAREQYVYCNDIVDQGLGTFSKLAACLMASNLWGFWWD